jgi:hypothetical protein
MIVTAGLTNGVPRVRAAASYVPGSASRRTQTLLDRSTRLCRFASAIFIVERPAQVAARICRAGTPLVGSTTIRIASVPVVACAASPSRSGSASGRRTTRATCAAASFWSSTTNLANSIRTVPSTVSSRRKHPASCARRCWLSREVRLGFSASRTCTIILGCRISRRWLGATGQPSRRASNGST